MEKVNFINFFESFIFVHVCLSNNTSIEIQWQPMFNRIFESLMLLRFINQIPFDKSRFLYQQIIAY